MHVERHRIGRAAAILLVAGVLLTVDACSSGTGSTPRQAAPVPSTTAASDPPPGPGLAAVAEHPTAGLAGTLLQFRRDVARRRVEVRLTATNEGLVVDGLDLRTPGLTASPGDPRGAHLLPDVPLDLPVVLGPADCSGPPGPPVAEVRLLDAAGGGRIVTVPLADDGLARRLHDADCADQALRAQAAVEVTAVRELATDDGPALRVTVRLRRVGGGDPVRVTGVGSNTVYAISAAGPLPTLRQEPVVVGLSLVPARCDTHALGESYRTGLIGLVLALGDQDPRPFVLTPEDDVRRQLETFAVDTCRSRDD